MGASVTTRFATWLCSFFYEKHKDFLLLDFGAGFETCMGMLEDGVQWGLGWACVVVFIVCNSTSTAETAQVTLCPRGRRKNTKYN